MCVSPVHYSFALLCSLNPRGGQDSPAVVLLLPVVAAPGHLDPN